MSLRVGGQPGVSLSYLMQTPINKIARHNAGFENSVVLKCQSLVYMFRNTSSPLHQVNAQLSSGTLGTFSGLFDQMIWKGVGRFYR